MACDLKGTGASTAPRGGPLGEGYSKREIAAELVDVMARSGHQRFAVVGHDRGACVAYRSLVIQRRPSLRNARAEDEH